MNRILQLWAVAALRGRPCAGQPRILKAKQASAEAYVAAREQGINAGGYPQGGLTADEIKTVEGDTRP